MKKNISVRLSKKTDMRIDTEIKEKQKKSKPIEIN